MSHLRILIRARRAALGHRLAEHSPTTLAAGGLGALVVAAAVVGLGELAADALMAVPAEVATGFGDAPLPPGARALEVAFWFAALASAVLGFRVMELLFRRADVRAVERYPVRLPALFVDRLIAALFEVVVVSAAGTLFFVPLVWHGGLLAAVCSVAIVVLGLTASSLVGLAVQLWAGEALLGSAKGARRTSDVGDIYGGPGQIFLYSPGIALALSVIAILLAKLAFGQVLGAGQTTRAFWLGFAILGGVSLVACASAYRTFTRSFPGMLARFHEADFVGFEASADYQTSAYDEARAGEGLLPATARPIFRAIVLQYGRRFMLARYGYVVFWLAGGLAALRLSDAALPHWARVMLAAVTLATVANPWTRLRNGRIDARFARHMAIGAADRERADALFGLREAMLVTLPYALAVLGSALLTDAGWADAAVLAGLTAGSAVALSGAAVAVARLTGSLRAGGLLGAGGATVLLLLLGANGLGWAAIGQTVLALGHLALVFRRPRDFGYGPPVRPSATP